MKRAANTARPEEFDAARIGALAQSIQQKGAILLSKLCPKRAHADVRSQIISELVRMGFEQGAKALRIPIEKQILTAVSGGFRIPRRDLGRRVKGATKAEIDGVLRALIASGKVRVVVRAQTEVLVSGEEKTLTSGELNTLKKLSDSLSKTLKKVSAKGQPRSILADDFLSWFEPLSAMALKRKSVGKPNTEEVFQALKAHEHPTLKLIRIPDFVRATSGQLGLASIHQSLHELAERGVIELRPEKGGEFLQPAEAQLCPPGSRGTVFSYARILRADIREAP